MQTTSFDRYIVKAEIGRGGMASVFRAYDPQTGRDVALKILPPYFMHYSDFMHRFQREARAVARLEHRNVVPIYDIATFNGQPYIVMRLMAGGSLTKRLEAGPLSPAEALRILRPIASALDAAHANGLVHRDIKPGNILFDSAGEPYLADFGLVKVMDNSGSISLTDSQSSLGTPAYMAPEQSAGKSITDHRVDIYALGVVLFRMLSGELPFQADTPLGYAVQHVTTPPPHLADVHPGLPPPIDAVVQRALAKEPSERFDTAGELVTSLEQVLAAVAANDAEAVRAEHLAQTRAKSLAQAELALQEGRWDEILLVVGQMQARDAQDPDAQHLLDAARAGLRGQRESPGAARKTLLALPGDVGATRSHANRSAVRPGRRRPYWQLGAIGILALLMATWFGASVRRGASNRAATATPQRPAVAALPSTTQPPPATTATRLPTIAPSPHPTESLTPVAALLTTEAQATQDVLSLAATAEIMTNVAQQATNATATAVAVCNSTLGYPFEVVAGPVLSPLPGSIYIRGNTPPAVTATWIVRIAGPCAWRQPQLRALANDAEVRIQVQLNGQDANELVPAQSTFTLTMFFEGPEDIPAPEATWRFLVLDEQGGDLDLASQGFILLNARGWMTVLEPTATPTNTRRPATPVPPTPVPPTPVPPTPVPPTPVPPTPVPPTLVVPTSTPSSNPTVPPKP